MSFRIASLAPAVLFGLIACASSDVPPTHGADGQSSGGPPGRHMAGTGDPFNLAARQVDEGQFELALPALRCIAGQGQGYEIAQYLAGFSALRLSEAAETPGVLKDEYRREGFDRLILAGQAGWPSAQAELAEAFLDTGTPDGINEAAYWSAVYARNTRDRSYGIDRLDAEFDRRLVSAVSSGVSERAEDRADDFRIEALPIVESGPECAPYLRRSMSGRGQMRMERSRQGRGPGGGRGGGRRPGG